MSRNWERGKRLLFCNVPPSQAALVNNLFGPGNAADVGVKIDLESALEWMEEVALQGNPPGNRTRMLTLEEIDFLDGVGEQELPTLRQLLRFREFKAGEAICHEGDAGDRMTLLVKGSVSVRLHVNDSRGGRRIASLGPGTMFGEMALIQGGRRSATIVTDEAVACYELSGDDFNMLLRDKPDLAVGIMRNIARELARRLRRTSEDLRHAIS